MNTKLKLATVAMLAIITAGDRPACGLGRRCERRRDPNQPNLYQRHPADPSYVPVRSAIGPGTMAPMSLLTYEESRPWARSIREKVATRYMPAVAH